jgi:hypothetical protein
MFAIRTVSRVIGSAALVSSIVIGGQTGFGQAYPSLPTGYPTAGTAATSTLPTSNLQPVFIRNRQFDIPVSVDSRGPDRPAELQLFVSRDSGRSWEFYSRESPDAGRFAFTAPADGEYWFAVSPNVRGPARAAQAPLAPGLRISVDTSQPIVAVDPVADAGGIVEVRFTIDDNAPDPAALQMYYRTDIPAATWLTLDNSRIAWNRNNDGKLAGQITFDPAVDWRSISLHIVATDRAGNQSTVQRMVDRPRVAGTQARLASVPQIEHTLPHAAGEQINPYFQPNSQIAGPQIAGPQIAGHQIKGQRTEISAGDNGYAIVTPEPPRPQPVDAVNNPSSNSVPPRIDPQSLALETESAVTYQQTANSGRPMYRGAQPNVARPLPPTSSTPASPRQSGESFASLPSGAAASDSAMRTSAPIEAPLPPSNGFRPIAAETLPSPDRAPTFDQARSPDGAIGNQSAPASGIIGDQAGYQLRGSVAATRQNDSGAQPTIVNRPASESDSRDTNLLANSPAVEVDPGQINYSRQSEFSLDYEFEAVGSRGIQRVELWGTRDGGKSWTCWGEDPDRASPFDITTSGSGLYGFSIVAIDSQNLTSPTPQPGDEAEIYILVDKTAPIVKLTAARYGEGAEAGSLIIEYSYRDDHAVGRPISLSFSDSPSGPWTTIATGLDDSGRYAWPADPRLPKNLYLRVEGTDRAGNTGFDINTTPISLLGLAPSARIKGFNPVGRD